MKTNVIGMDIAKRIIQLHTVCAETGEIGRFKLQRRDTLAFLARRVPAIVALEACGSAHWWAREISRLGHEVRLLAPKSVRPFVLRNKTDAADARAIWTAAQQPEARFVAVKTELQQSILALHRLRAQLLKFRIMQSNALRGILYEFGTVLPEGMAALGKALPGALAELESRLPAVLMASLREQWARIQGLDAEIAVIERRLTGILKESPPCQAIARIPGIGLLTATAAVASIGDANTFRSGRELAAWLGLVPKQRGTGGWVRQLGLSKRGDVYLRTLLMHGARAVVLRHGDQPWLAALRARRPFNVVVAAVANKLARTLWAVLAKGEPFKADQFGLVTP
jgi:transposase